jgi:hypothetical protein
MAEEIDTGKFAEWLNKHWVGQKRCPICQSNDWRVSKKAVELREFHGAGLALGGPIYPLVSLTCKVCGHTLLFNAIVAKLIAQKEKEEPKEERKKEEKEEGSHDGDEGEK